MKKEDFNGMTKTFEEMMNEMKKLQSEIMEMKQEQKSSILGQSKINAIHCGTSCAVCKISPIEGKRYKCMICSNF